MAAKSNSECAGGASVAAPDIFIHEAFLLGTGDSAKFLQPAVEAGGSYYLSAGNEPAHQGIIELYQTAIGFVGVRSTASRTTILIPPVATGAWTFDWAFKLSQLSVAADRFILGFGLANDILGYQTRLCALVYSDNINGGEFVLRTTDSGGTANWDSNVAAVANTWYYARLVVTRESVELYLDTVPGTRTLRCTVITNIPTDALAIVGGFQMTAATGGTIGVIVDDFKGSFVEV